MLPASRTGRSICQIRVGAIDRLSDNVDMLFMTDALDLSSERFMVNDALPRLAHGPDLSDRVNLVWISPEEERFLEGRAVRSKIGSWSIPAGDLGLRQEWDEFLPRVARWSITPELVDLIPAGSWFASLANLLVGSSWKAIKDPFLTGAGACEECGDTRNLEGHEIWRYDKARSLQSLDGIRCLCSRCHATQHLGRANVLGNFGGVFHRLCTINRIEKWEEELYREAIFSLFEERSRIEWSLDLSQAVQAVGSLSLKADVLFAGDGWIHRPADGERGEAAMRVTGCDIGYDGKRLVFVPSGEL